MSAYGASKVALVYLTEVLSEELEGKDIQVNALSPGSIHTRMWEETLENALTTGDDELIQLGKRVVGGRGASIERATELAVFLASDACGKLSGRLIQAYSDDFESFPDRIPEIMESNLYTLRRVGD